MSSVLSQLSWFHQKQGSMQMWWPKTENNVGGWQPYPMHLQTCRIVIAEQALPGEHVALFKPKKTD
jgi:hypothetical protein